MAKSRVSIPSCTPLFDVRESLEYPPPDCVITHLNALPLGEAKKEYDLTREFLKSYSGSQDTFLAYRREVERLLQWSWRIAHIPIKELNRNHLRDYLDFIQNPPQEWVATQSTSRFMENELSERVPNPPESERRGGDQ